MRLFELNESRLNDITLSNLKNILPSYTDALNAMPIYRGLDHPDDPFTFKLAKSGSNERAAANTNNHSNMIVSNSPDWADYPKRNHAFICTSDSDYAEQYGSLYRMLPKNGTEIGVCSDNDFWISFPYLTKNLLNFIDLNESLAMIAQGRLSDSNYAMFKHQLDSLSPEAFLVEEQTTRLYDLSLEWGLEPSEALEQLLSPYHNKFKIQTIKQFNATNKEVWFTGECLVVHPEYMDQILEFAK